MGGVLISNWRVRRSQLKEIHILSKVALTPGRV
jgi:hypothetical protein